MGSGMILVIDDFHLIKPRSDARLKIFVEKVLSKKVNLILVSNSELKLEILPKMKKVKLESLDEFETDMLAYNLMDIQNI